MAKVWDGECEREERETTGTEVAFGFFIRLITSKGQVMP